MLITLARITLMRDIPYLVELNLHLLHYIDNILLKHFANNS